MRLPEAEIKRIIVFRALQLGDLLCSVPAIRALKHAYPLAEITLAGLPWARSFTERFSAYFDHFIWFPGYPGLPEQKLNPESFTTFLTEVQSRKFDLAIQLQGNGSVVNPMVELFGAKYTAGFRKNDHYSPDNGLFMDYPDYGAEPERHLLLMDHLGIPRKGNQLEFPINDQDRSEFEKLALPVQPGKYVCIHPGSRGSWRQWPTVHFAALADLCIEKGYQAVLTGTHDELGIVNEVGRYMKYQPIIAAGRTSLGAVGILLQQAYALVSNCTGVSHMASALETPSIVISMDGEPARWAPQNRALHQLVDWTVNPNFEMVFKFLLQLLEKQK